MNGLPVKATAWISPARARSPQLPDDVAQARHAGGAQGVGLGVVAAVVEGDERERARAGGHLDVADERARHELVGQLGGEVGGAHHASFCVVVCVVPSASSPVVRFSQMRAAPIPIPMHIAVIP